MHGVPTGRRSLALNQPATTGHGMKTHRPPTSPGRTHPAVALLATSLVCLLVLAIAQFISHTRVDEFDAWLFAYYGKQLLHGRVLYGELWDNKPPGIFWLNAVALWLSRGSLAGPIAACALAVCGSCVAFLAATKRLYGLGPATVATVLAAVYLNQQYFHVGCNRPNTFGVLTDLLAFLFYVRGLAAAANSMFGRYGAANAGISRHGTSPPHHGPSERTLDRTTAGGQLLAAGFCAGLGLWFQQTALGLAAAVVVHQLMMAAGRKQPWRETRAQLGWFGLGWVAAVGLGVALVLLTADARWAWNAVFAFNRAYFAPGVGSRWIPHWFGLREQVEVLALPAILGVATLIHAAAVGLARPRERRTLRDPFAPDDGSGMRPPYLLGMLWVWMATGAYLALIGPHQRLPYFGVALPPLCLLAAHGVHLFFTSGRDRDDRYPPYYVLLGVVWFGYMLFDPLSNQLHALNLYYYQRFEDPDRDSDRRREIAGIIDSHTAPDETIFVWAYDPELYWHAGRPSAVRYVATEKAHQLGDAGQAVMTETIRLLRENPPKVLVLEPNELDRIEHPRPNNPLRYDGLAPWIRENYALAPEDRHHDVWIRQDRPGAEPGRP